MSSKRGDPQLSEISRKLDTLIHLSALGLVRDIKTQKQQIAFLSDAGFQPKEIADVIGTTSNTVSVALHAIRRERAAKEHKEQPVSKEQFETAESGTQSEVEGNAEEN